MISRRKKITKKPNTHIAKFPFKTGDPQDRWRPDAAHHLQRVAPHRPGDGIHGGERAFAPERRALELIRPWGGSGI